MGPWARRDPGFKALEGAGRGGYNLEVHARNRRLAPRLVLLILAASPANPAAAHPGVDICPGSAVPEGGAACRFTLRSSEGCNIELDPDGTDCRGLERISAIFVKLREAAGFGEDQLGHLCGTIDWPETPLASYTAWNRCVNVNIAFLRKHGGDDVAIQSALAHEISHGIQDRRGDMAWAVEVADDESPEGEREFRRRRRILEAQADTISIQLLERAGLPPDTAKKGFAIRHGSSWAAAEETDADSSTHPTERSRWLNMTIAASWMSVASSEKKLLEAARRGLDSIGAVEAPISPFFYREDFSDRGDIQLKRLLSERFHRELPPPGTEAAP